MFKSWRKDAQEMKKTFIFALLITLSSISFAQKFNLAGTFWAGKDGTKQLRYEMYFFSNGTYQVSYFDEQGKKVMINNTGVGVGNWTQSGDSIYMETNNKFSERRGVIKGNLMYGTATNQKGDSWVWSYQLVNQSSTSSGNSEFKPEIQNKSNPKLESSSSQLSAPHAKSQPAPSNLKQSGNRGDIQQTLEQQAYCFGVFNGLNTLNIGFNQSGNNEYFKKYKNEFFKIYTPILDKVEPCLVSNRPVTGNVMLQCGKKTLNEREYQLFVRNGAGYADVYEANQKKDGVKLGALKIACSVLNIN